MFVKGTRFPACQHKHKHKHFWRTKVVRAMFVHLLEVFSAILQSAPLGKMFYGNGFDELT